MGVMGNCRFRGSADCGAGLVPVNAAHGGGVFPGAGFGGRKCPRK